MSILLIIYVIFVLIYIGYNTYGLIQIFSKRFKGDAAGIVIVLYVIGIILILMVTMIFIGRLNWGQSITGIIKLK